MEATLIRKDQRQYLKSPFHAAVNIFSNKIVALEKGGFWFNKIEAHGRIKSHNHKALQLNMIENGSARMRVDERDYILHEGDAIVVPSEATHEMESQIDGQEVSYLEVKWKEV